jgi:hypothetical protein
VIGHLATTAALVNGKARVEHVGAIGAGAGGVERRMLDQPDQLGRFAAGDGLDACLHEGDRILVSDG